MRLLAIALGVAATVAWWYLLEDVSAGGLALASIYVVSPWLAVAAESTPLRTRARATALVVLGFMSVASYPTGDTSGAPIGTVLVPLYQWIAVSVIVVIDAALVRARGD